MMSKRNFEDGFFQNTLGSGTIRLALNQMENLSNKLLSLFSMINAGSFNFPLLRVFNIPYGSQIGNFKTSRPEGILLTRDLSRSSKSGFSGVNTKGSQP